MKQYLSLRYGRCIFHGLFSLLLLVICSVSAYSQPPDCDVLYMQSGSVIYNYNVVTNTQTTNTISCPGQGLAVAKNFFNNGPSPTFYTVVGGNYSYYDGTTWVNTGHSAGNYAAVNPGGAGDYIYNVDGINGEVYKYDGTGNSVPFLNLGNWSGPYDCVGDNSGNLYLLSTPSQNQQLLVYDNNANLICTYNVINCPPSPAGGGFAIVNGVVLADLWPGLFSGTVTGPLTITMSPGTYSSVNAGDYGSCPLGASNDSLFGDPEVCVNGTTTISSSNSNSSGFWQSSNSGIATVNNSGVVSGISGGNVTISFIDTTHSGAVGLGGGCVGNSGDSLSIDVTVNPLPVVDLGNDTGFCSGGKWILDAGNPGSSYIWSTNATTQTIEVSMGGHYSVTVTDTNGCVNSGDIDIQVTDLKYGTLDTVICEGQSLRFGGQTYSSDVKASDSVRNRILLPTGCDSIVTLILRIQPLPTLKIEPESRDYNFCIGEEIGLAGEGADRYNWWSGDGADLGKGKHIIASLLKNENVFWMRGMDKWSCADSVSIKIDAVKCCPIYVPSAFSPNNDGVNDGFRAEGDGHPPKYRIQIYNRLGQKVFTSIRIDEKWDGTFNNKPCDIGVYYYYITGECGNGTTIKEKGTVTLVR